mmetsp:Transcript_2644/g.4612  ORF Transcript_2644/g.4612 Transcript_2644/m.4612 type:complete len:168 (-) Transcript_2644:42-545(-)
MGTMTCRELQNLRKLFLPWSTLQTQIRGSKIQAKKTHHHHHHQHLKTQEATPKKPVMVNPRDIPSYDLSKLPSEFEALRHEKHSEVLRWITAIAKKIGDKHVSYPDKIVDKDKFRIIYGGYEYHIHSSLRHQELNSKEKKTVLNVLAHMGVFGDVKVKSGEEELIEE